MILTVPSGAAMIVCRYVRWYGAGSGVETGGFFITPRDDVTVQIVALGGEVGVLREPYRFAVSGAAIEHLAEWAETRGMLISAQFHSHDGSAFLSPVDKAGGYRIEGFISAVLPNFRDPPASVNAWGWWEFQRGEWVSKSPPHVGGVCPEIIVFDAGGVRKISDWYWESEGQRSA